MSKEAEDKAKRILSIYAKLKDGKVVNKTQMSVEFAVNPRTIQRDIADIQCFLQNQNNETGEMQEIIFDRMSGGYRLQTLVQNELHAKEVLAACKVLLESRALTKGELFPIISKLMNMCSDTRERRQVKEFLSNEMHHYVELKHGVQLLERIWQLEKAVKEARYIEITYRKRKNQTQVRRRVKPVGVMFSEFYYYLTAYIEDIDKEKAFRNPEDTFPTIYRVDRIEEISLLEEYFVIPYRDRFEEGEFRKRVQFMYGGQLRRIRFKYSGNDVDAILDRLPTAVIRGFDDGVYTLEAEVFGDGVDMWLRSQGERIELLEERRI